MEHLPGIAAVIAATAALVKATADLIATIRKDDDEERARGGPGVEQVPRGRPPGKHPTRPDMKNRTISTTWLAIAAAALTAWAAASGLTGWAIAAGAITVAAVGVSLAAHRARR